MKQESGRSSLGQQSELVDPAINRVLAAEAKAREAVAECERRAADLIRRAETRCRRISQQAERRMQRAQLIADQGVERALAELRAPLSAGTDPSLRAEDDRIIALASALVEELIDPPSPPGPARAGDEARR